MEPQVEESQGLSSPDGFLWNPIVFLLLPFCLCIESAKQILALACCIVWHLCKHRLGQSPRPKSKVATCYFGLPTSLPH